MQPGYYDSENYTNDLEQGRRQVDRSKVQKTRACDLCRRRKTKCDGPKKAGNICSNCLQNNRACTYVEASVPRGPSKSYVIGLEDKLEKLEAVLKRLRPDQDFSAELGPPVVRDSWKNAEPSREASSSRSHIPPPPEPSRLAPYLDKTMATGMSSHLKINNNKSLSHPTKHRRPRQGFVNASSESSESDSSDMDELVDNFENGMQRLTLRTSRTKPEQSSFDRFQGQSSSITLVDATRKLKQAHIMAQKEGRNTDSNAPNLSPSPELQNSLRRSEYWRAPTWELKYEGLHVDSPTLLNSVLQRLPDDDLAEELISLYFQHVNIHFPLLNERIFYRQWRERLHERDIWYCALSMCVFAAASRWSNDPRVLCQAQPKHRSHELELEWTTAGSDFFNTAIAIHRARRSLLYTPTLFEVQTFTLLALFLRGTSDYSAGWILVAVGLRKAQDVGAHRKTVYMRKPTANEELWKRAFWSLVILDRTGSTSLGRSCGIGEEDFDLELPLEVDDDYWDTENPAVAFKQPPGLPCKVTAFNLWIQITQIVAFTLRTLYALDPKKIFLGRKTLPDSETIVKQLDVALDEWADSVPEHLQWSNQTDSGDLTTSNLSASLHLSYHHTHILIYKIFIPFSQILPPNVRGISRSSEKPSSLSLPALTICVNAAKACARIVEEQMKRGFSNVPFLITISNVCTGILIVNLWDLKAKEIAERSTHAALMEDVKPRYALAIQSVKEDIDIFLSALEWAKPRYPSVTQILAKLRASFPSAQSDLSERERYSLQEPNHFQTAGSSPVWLSPGMPSSTPNQDWGDYPSHHNFPLRPSSYSMLVAPPERLPAHPLHRRDSDPVIRQSLAFWPTSQPRPSHPQVPENRHATYSSLPFISSVRRSSFTSPQRSRRYASPSPSRHDQHNSFYQVNTGDYGRDMYQHLPTSDARSIPTQPAYEKRGYSRESAWDDYHAVYPRGNDHPSWT